jgi:hypothetical protein
MMLTSIRVTDLYVAFLVSPQTFVSELQQAYTAYYNNKCGEGVKQACTAMYMHGSLPLSKPVKVSTRSPILT